MTLLQVDRQQSLVVIHKRDILYVHATHITSPLSKTHLNHAIKELEYMASQLYGYTCATLLFLYFLSLLLLYHVHVSISYVDLVLLPFKFIDCH